MAAEQIKAFQCMTAKQTVLSPKLFINSSFHFEEIEKTIRDGNITNFHKSHVIDFVVINVKFDYEYNMKIKYKTKKCIDCK